MGIVLLTKIVLIISTHPHGAHTLWLQSFLVFLCLQELNQSLCILCRSHNFYTAISRKVVGKKCARDNPKCNMGYDQYTVPGDCSCQAYFCCFPLALANMSMASRAILSNFFEEQLTQNHPQYGIVACTFSNNLSQNICIQNLLQQEFDRWLPEITIIILIDSEVKIVVEGTFSSWTEHQATSSSNFH